MESHCLAIGLIRLASCPGKGKIEVAGDKMASQASQDETHSVLIVREEERKQNRQRLLAAGALESPDPAKQVASLEVKKMCHNFSTIGRQQLSNKEIYFDKTLSVLEGLM